MRVHVVINPGSGQPQPVLHTLNTVFRAAGVEWDASLTHQSGDARIQARDAAAAGVDVVAVYGGDGTVMEVAEGVEGTAALLGVLPGGTASILRADGFRWISGLPTASTTFCDAALDGGLGKWPMRHANSRTAGACWPTRSAR
jgi:hypothetical protein